MNQKEQLDNKYWREYKDKSAMAGITLDDTISPSDFETYGNRLSNKQIEMFKTSGDFDISKSSVLDIGCGMGRILKPFSKKFKTVIGVDINAQILEVAKAYTQSSDNIELIQNNGKSVPFEDNSFDYVYSGGVLQHIPEIDIITNYFREGLRVLKVDGVLNFSVQVWMILRKGGVHGDRVGAQIRATDIEAILNETGHELVKIYYDEKDPVPHFNILIKKVNPETALKNIEVRKKTAYTIKPEIVEKMEVRTGIFEDLESYSEFKGLWAKKKIKHITFFKQSPILLCIYILQAVINKIKG